MTTRRSFGPRSGRRSPRHGGAGHRAAWLSLGLAWVLVACSAAPTPSPSPSATPAATETAAPSAAQTPEGTPAPAPEPPLSLALPGATDARQVSVTVTPEVPPDGGGVITVTVTSAAHSMIEELVLRWPTELLQTLFVAPRVPDPDLVREGGGNLVVPWTKWVIGPGEQGEPAGTTSLGYGPLEPGATLTIPLYVTRLAPGPTSFDLQLLAGESILALTDGQPAELRVEVP
jgi:hypothetical protein